MIEEDEAADKEGRPRSHAEYTVESWNISGHWRHYKESGKTIWISEHPAHRNLPLSQKEVHLKL